MLLGPRTVIYPAPDLAVSKAWFIQVTGSQPYFDEPFYVGFEVGGFELGLDPAADVALGPVTYWGVENADRAYADLLAMGAESQQEIQEVGEGIRIGAVRSPTGDVLGIIENPHFGSAGGAGDHGEKGDD
jgi:hypothetical protein